MTKNQYMADLSPDEAYLREGVYLPKKKINLQSTKMGLTFEHVRGLVTLYEELPNHLVVPRNFLDLSKIQKWVKVNDLRPSKYSRVEFGSKIVLRNELQIDASKELTTKEGILVLPCGAGKTVVALQEVARRKVPTLVIVNTEQILEQWKERIEEYLTVKKIGRIQGKTFECDAPIVVAMIQTLAKQRGKIPEKIRKYFGLVIWDEVDETTTPVYSLTSDMFYGSRLGLTATKNRKDGLEKIFEYHIGPILYLNEEFSIKPKVFFFTNTTNMPSNMYMNYYNMNTNYGKLYTLLSKESNRNELIQELVDKKLAEGRKILVLGERKEQLIELHEKYKNSGLCIHEVEVKDRLEMLRRCKVIFAIRKLSKRALDQVDLDTLLLINPITDPGGIRQACGRIVRECSDKKSPEVLIIRDVNIPPMRDMCDKMERQFREWKFEYSNIGRWK